MDKRIETKEIYTYTMVCTFVFGIIAHGYGFYNLNYSHDSMGVYQNDYEWQISLGRFFQPIYVNIIRGNIYTPTLIGVLSLVFIGIAIIILCRLFKIKEKALICLICGILVTNTTIILSNATYINFTDIFMLAMLLAVIGVYTCREYKYGVFIGAGLFCLSLGLYQAYFQFAVSIFMMLAIIDILSEESYQKVLRDGIRAIISLLIGLALYYCLLRIILFITDITLSSSYNGLTEVGKYDSINHFANLFIGAYGRVVETFVYPVTFHANLIKVVNIFLLFVLIFLIGYMLKNRKIQKNEHALLLLLFLFLPLGLNIIFIISHGMEHELMIYSFFLLYVFIIAIFNNLLGKRENSNKKEMVKTKIIEKHLKYTIILSLGIVIFCNVIYANQVYLKKDLEYRATDFTMGRVIDRMEQTEGYIVGKTPVVIVGTLQTSAVSAQRQGFDYDSVGLGDNFSVTYPNSYYRYFKSVLAYPINFVAPSQWSLWKEKVKSMPSFPKENFCQIIEDTMVIKLSE